MAKRVDSKGRILRTGEQQRAQDGRYLYRYTDIIGQRKTIYAMTLAELREKEKELQRDLADHIDVAGGNMTLNQLFNLYMDTKTNIKESSRANYMKLWRIYVKESEIGLMKIKNIKSAHIRKLYAALTEKGFSEGTIKSIHMLISSAFDLAVDSDMIRKNPAKNCSKDISGGKRKREALTRIEQNELMSFLEGDRTYSNYSSLITFFLNTGLRVGELSGLRWENVDLKNNIVHVRQQLVYSNYGEGCKFHLQSLKTENAERSIPLTQEARKALIQQREQDFKKGIKREEIEGVDDFVFVNSKGMPMSVTAINFVLSRIVKKYNNQSESFALPAISAHILRHTFASRAVEAGMDAKTLQIILGHSDISTTMNVYVQMDDGEIRRKFYEAAEGMKVG